MGTCCPGVGMSSFLCNKLDILICSYIYLGSILHFYMPTHVISGKIHAKLYALIRQTSEFVHVLLRSLAGGLGIIFHNKPDSGDYFPQWLSQKFTILATKYRTSNRTSTPPVPTKLVTKVC